MKYKGVISAALKDLGTRNTIIQFTVQGDIRKDLEKFNNAEVELEVKKFHQKRSLDSNNYAWLLMDKIAKTVNSTKEEVYLHLLEKYGTFIYLPCEEEKVNQIEAVFRIVRDRGTTFLTTPSGKTVCCKQLQCYKGSSLMDSLEMSQFLDGVVSEAEALGIQTETPEEIERMNAAWQNVKNQ